jgi:hypothetical protein
VATTNNFVRFVALGKQPPVCRLHVILLGREFVLWRAPEINNEGPHSSRLSDVAGNFPITILGEYDRTTRMTMQQHAVVVATFGNTPKSGDAPSVNFDVSNSLGFLCCRGEGFTNIPDGWQV